MKMNQRAGIIYMLLAMLTFTLVNALIKGTIVRYPVNEIVFFRFFFSLLPCALIVWIQEGRQGFIFHKPLFQVARGCLGTVALTFMFYSFGALPLADAMAITFSGALFTVIFSIPILKEHPRFAQWMAILCGFVGVLIIAKPTGNIGYTAALAAVIGAALDAVSMASGRLLTRTISPGNMAFYFAVVATLVSGSSLMYNGIMPLPGDWLPLAFMGIGGGVAQYFIAKAYALAPTAAVAPMIYSAAIWSILVGYIVWGDLPDWQTLIGMGIVIASGCYVAIKGSPKV